MGGGGGGGGGGGDRNKKDINLVKILVTKNSQ